MRGEAPSDRYGLPQDATTRVLTVYNGIAFHGGVQPDGATTVRLIVWSNEPREEAGRIAVGYREPGYVRTTVHEYVGSAQDQCVTAFRQTAGKSYPSPDWNGRATSSNCSRTLACSSEGSDRRTCEEDADVSVR